MVHEGGLVFPDISELHKEMEAQTLSEAKAQDRIRFLDNPYALVAQREDINPWTGNKKPNHNKLQNNNNNNANNKPGDNRNPNNRGRQQQNQQDNNRRYEPYDQSTKRQRSGKYEERAQDRSKGYRSQDQGYQNQSGPSNNQKKNL
jgi:hypothetical protein